MANKFTDHGLPGVYNITPSSLSTGQGSALSTDERGSLAILTPRTVALARTVDTTISASTEVDFNAATTFLRVYAIDKDVYMKWGTTAVTSSNFDEVIPANQICDFYVPLQTGTTLYAAATFIERAATGGIIVIEK